MLPHIVHPDFQHFTTWLALRTAHPWLSQPLYERLAKSTGPAFTVPICSKVPDHENSWPVQQDDPQDSTRFRRAFLELN